MKKPNYFWLLSLVALNLLIWVWSSGFISEQIGGVKTEQPVRALEELNPDLVRLNKTTKALSPKPSGEMSAAPRDSGLNSNTTQTIGK